MRNAGSVPILGTSLIKIIRLPQVGQLELLALWSMLRYSATARALRFLRQPKGLGAAVVNSLPDAVLVRVFSISSRRALFQELRRVR